MAHTKQALKRDRQNQRLRVKNRAMHADVKTHMKALDAALAAKDSKKIASLALLTQSKLDKAAQRRVIHPNAAARLKARIAKLSAAPPKAK